MNYCDYIVSTNHASEIVLSQWRWLIGPTLQLWHVTKAGDALLRDPGDGSIHFLDVIAGTVDRVAKDRPEFESVVNSLASAKELLMCEIVDGQALLGMRPGPNQCLSFKHPPVLGGQLTPENLETCDVVTHFSIAGQIHRQVKDVPLGTEIVAIETENPPGEKTRPWWKLW